MKINLKKSLLLLVFPFLIANHSCEIAVDDYYPYTSFYYYSVPEDFTTIQDAIDNAYPGDTVKIKAGIYSPSTNGENFPIILKDGVHLEGDSSSSTILDAELSDTVLEIINNSGVNISKLTIKNGKSNEGAGIYALQSQVTLQNLVIRNNRANIHGSAIYFEDCTSSSLINSSLYNNYSDGIQDSEQIIISNSDVDLISNTIDDDFGDAIVIE